MNLRQILSVGRSGDVDREMKAMQIVNIEQDGRGGWNSRYILGRNDRTSRMS